MPQTYHPCVLNRDLEWLLAVADEGHVTRAAARLGVAQPTLSRAIGRIEAELDTRIFERLPGGVAVGADGELVLAAARDLTARHRRLVAELAARHDPESGVVRFAFIDSLASSLVPRLLGDFHRAAPRIRVMLSQEPGHEIMDDLARGAVELAIRASAPEGDFGWHPLQTETLVAIVAPRHRLAGRRRIDLRDLEGDELVTTPVGFGFRTLVDGLLAEAGLRPVVAFESGDLAAIEGLVAAGLGVAIVPEQFAGVTGSVGLSLAGRGAQRVIGVTWRRDRPLAAPARRMLDFIVEEWDPTGARSGADQPEAIFE